jgi:hypothetical protein
VDNNSTFNSTRRYLVRPDTTNTIVSQVVQDLGPGFDMGSPTHLNEFIAWAKLHYPADRYCVVIWNHGNGWARGFSAQSPQPRGVSYDDETHNHIETWQLSQALGSGVNDIVAWDSSLMQQMEVNDEIKDQACYIVGSDESPPEQGYRFDLTFAHFRDTPDAITLDLAKTFVDETVNFYGGVDNITQSVIDTSQLPALVTATSGLSDAMIANQGALTTIAPQVRSAAQRYDDNNSLQRHYRDLYDIGLQLENFGAPAPVITAEQAVRAAITNAVVYERHNVNSPGSHGVAIDFSSSGQFAGISGQYANLKFAQETTWDSWLAIAP